MPFHSTAGWAVRPKPLLRFMLAAASAGRGVPFDGSAFNRPVVDSRQNWR